MPSMAEENIPHNNMEGIVENEADAIAAQKAHVAAATAAQSVSMDDHTDDDSSEEEAEIELATLGSQPVNQQKALSPEQTKEALKHQVEHYLSLANLRHDHHLVSQMDAQHFVPVSVLAGFPKVQALTEDLNELVAVLDASNAVVLDDTKTKVRPAENLVKRNTLIIRDIPEGTTGEDIMEVFKVNECPTPIENHSEVGNTWFIKFETEAETTKAFQHITKQKLKGQPIKARIKSENILRTSNVPQTAIMYPDQSPVYGGNPYAMMPPPIVEMGAPQQPQQQGSGKGKRGKKGKQGRNNQQPNSNNAYDEQMQQMYGPYGSYYVPVEYYQGQAGDSSKGRHSMGSPAQPVYMYPQGYTNNGRQSDGGLNVQYRRGGGGRREGNEQRRKSAPNAKTQNQRNGHPRQNSEDLSKRLGPGNFPPLAAQPNDMGYTKGQFRKYTAADILKVSEEVDASKMPESLQEALKNEPITEEAVAQEAKKQADGAIVDNKDNHHILRQQMQQHSLSSLASNSVRDSLPKQLTIDDELEKQQKLPQMMSTPQNTGNEHDEHDDSILNEPHSKDVAKRSTAQDSSGVNGKPADGNGVSLESVSEGTSTQRVQPSSTPKTASSGSLSAGTTPRVPNTFSYAAALQKPAAQLPNNRRNSAGDLVSVSNNAKVTPPPEKSNARNGKGSNPRLQQWGESKSEETSKSGSKGQQQRKDISSDGASVNRSPESGSTATVTSHVVPTETVKPAPVKKGVWSSIVAGSPKDAA
eukprot:Clim_evm19s109 gene=Clim_evmTU19s109